MTRNKKIILIVLIILLVAFGGVELFRYANRKQALSNSIKNITSTTTPRQLLSTLASKLRSNHSLLTYSRSAAFGKKEVCAKLEKEMDAPLSQCVKDLMNGINEDDSSACKALKSVLEAWDSLSCGDLEPMYAD